MTPEKLLRYKTEAAREAVAQIRSGMVVGLGAGSTAALALKRLAELLAEGRLEKILGVPCSNEVERKATRLGVPLTTLAKNPVVDLTIDGADEVDPHLNLIKGLGGALLREKIVAQASQREIIVVDETKLSPVLGTRGPLPIEVFPFGWLTQAEYIGSIGGDWILRNIKERLPFLTDQGNFILDVRFGPIADPKALAQSLDGRAGIAAHGLFIGLASEVIVAGPSGVRHLTRESTRPDEEPGPW
jgi:ribose 5-phosphate isomerase A